MGEELADSERALQRLQRTKGPMGSQWLTQEVLLYATVPNGTYELELERDGLVGES